MKLLKTLVKSWEDITGKTEQKWQESIKAGNAALKAQMRQYPEGIFDNGAVPVEKLMGFIVNTRAMEGTQIAAVDVRKLMDKHFEIGKPGLGRGRSAGLSRAMMDNNCVMPMVELTVRNVGGDGPEDPRVVIHDGRFRMHYHLAAGNHKNIPVLVREGDYSIDETMDFIAREIGMAPDAQIEMQAPEATFCMITYDVPGTPIYEPHTVGPVFAIPEVE